MASKVQQGAQVTIHYTLHAGDEMIETSRGQQPLTYTQGQQQIVPGLEEGLDGMEVGESKQITLAPEQAYGPSNPEAIQSIPKDSFKDADSLSAGDRVAGEADGRQFHALVTDVGDDTITLDFNHPLAGKTLAFDVEVVDVAIAE